MQQTDFWAQLSHDFYQSFIEDDRWRMMLQGLGTTLKVTVFALIFGVILGLVIAIIRSTYDQQRRRLRGGGGFILRLLNGVCRIYLTVIRGTPVMVQLLIMFFVIMVSSTNMELVAIITFSINSGAYVAEIFRSGIMSVDPGQMEAGRSLGLNYVQTMWRIIVPQAFKNVLPALVNELITLLKETSIVTVIGLRDMTKQAQNIQALTYQAFFPLIAAAVVYLAIVMILSWFLGGLERRLRGREH